MEIAISLELGMNVNVFEFYVDSLTSSFFLLTSSITFLAFFTPICSLRLNTLIFDHVSSPAATHHLTLNQSLVVPSRNIQGRPFQPIASGQPAVRPENSPVN